MDMYFSVNNFLLYFHLHQESWVCFLCIVDVTSLLQLTCASILSILLNVELDYIIPIHM